MDGIILIDKPSGCTSHDIVARVRRIIGQKRVGHAGTLDPLATGLLVVLAGRATRASDYIMNGGKEYVAGIRLGMMTDTQDITGRVTGEFPVNCGEDEVRRALAALMGKIMQIPPMYSAIKVNGQPLYRAARSGAEVERAPREVEIYSSELLTFDGVNISARFSCSKGTYIRTLADDLGRALGCGAVMSSLRRTRSSSFSLDEALTPDELTSAVEEGRYNPVPVEAAFAEYKAVELSGIELNRLRCGRFIEARELTDGLYRVFSGGSFVALGQCENGRLKTKILFEDNT